MNTFIRKLAQQKVLQIVEPNEDLSQAYFEKAKKSLASAKATAKIGSLEDATALSYYAMYHSLTALLLRTGIKCENHTAAIILFRDVFGQDNTTVAFAKKERIDKQYYADFAVTEEDVKTSILVAENFLAFMYDFLAKMSEQQVLEFNKKAKKLLEE